MTVCILCKLCDIIPITKAGNVIWRRNFHLFSRTDMTRTELQKQANGKTYDRLTELKIFGILMTLSLHIQKIFLHKQRGRKPTFGESQLYNSLTPGGKNYYICSFALRGTAMGIKLPYNTGQHFFWRFSNYMYHKKHGVFLKIIFEKISNHPITTLIKVSSNSLRIFEQFIFWKIRLFNRTIPLLSNIRDFWG